MQKLPINIFQERRKNLIKKIKSFGGGIAIIPNSEHHYRNGKNYYKYRHNSNFYYLSGFTEPKSCLVLIAGEEEKSILFCLNKNKEREIWEGKSYGPEMAKDFFKFTQSYPIEDFEKKLATIINESKQNSLYLEIEKLIEKKSKLFGFINQQLKETKKIKNIFDVSAFINEMRIIKDKDEIETMKLASKISANAHIEILKYCDIGMYEYELEAKLLYEFRKNGAQSIAYDNIVASGENSCILHYTDCSKRINNGDLVLIDAGCELDSYASDITRTFPANGRYTPQQLAIYEIVLAAQKEAIEYCKPGNNFNSPHQAAVKMIIQGLIDEKIIIGDRDEIIEKQKYKEFYPHSTSHWIGLDVHDVGEYYSKLKNNCIKWKELKQGMLLTIEPGIYIKPADYIPESFWNIGIRIEDTVLIDKNGHEIISRDVPVEAKQIEEIMCKN